ncbi:ArnT family glycosyltransferase [Desulfonema ishimotonii]|nr:glycosyltransferase family 39 protein [Desulfonema ishimotonii]
MPKTNHYDSRILFFCLLLCLLFAYTWATPFRDIYGLETRNALMAREMTEGGLTLIPHALGRPYPDYPPLYFWMATLFSMPLGQVSTLSIVLPSALSAIGLVTLTFCLGRGISRRTGWLAALILATCPDFWMKAGSGTIDMLLAFHVTATILCLWFRDRATSFKNRMLYATGVPVFLALAFLTKGPLGIVLPGAAWGGYLLCERRLRDVVLFSLFLACMGLLCIGGELAIVRKTGGAELVREVVKMQVTERLGQKANHPFYYYLICLAGIGHLWWIFCYPVLARFRAGIQKNGWIAGFRQAMPVRPVYRLTLVWFLSTLAIFTLASTRHGRYLLPLFPALSILLAAGTERLPDRDDIPHPRIWETGAGLLIVLFLVDGVGFILLYPRFIFVPIPSILIWMAAVSGGWVVIRKRIRDGLRPVALIFLVLAAGLSGVNLMALPAISRRASGRAFVMAAESQAEARTPVVIYNISADGDGVKYALHSSRKPSTLRFIDGPEALRNVPRPCLLIARDRDEKEMRQGFLPDERRTPVARGRIRSKRLSAYLLKAGH